MEPARKAALKAGKLTYYTGKPCPNGHIAERYTKSMVCITCMRVNTKQGREMSPERRAALDAGHVRFFTGKPCIHGHIAPRYAVSGYCVPCGAATAGRSRRAAYWNHPERGKLRQVKTKESNTLGRMLYAAKYRAKAQGREFSLSREDIVIPSNCPCCRQEIVISGTLGARQRGSPSLDRIDNAVGYIPTNIAIICWDCNRLKGTATADELEMVAKWMRSMMPSPEAAK